MIVYTFQNPNILEAHSSEIICSPKYWDKDMVTYYEWMYGEYQKRIGSQTKSLIWVWEHIPEWYFEYDEEEETDWHNNQADRYRLLITLEIPEERILWSDYDAWHCPLNDGSVLNELEIEEEEQGKVFDTMYGWERVFDFEWLEHNGWGIGIKQGVVDSAHRAVIKEVKYYDARYKKFIDNKEAIQI